MPRKLNDRITARDKLLTLYQRLTLVGGRRHFQADIARDLGCSPQTVTRLISVIEQHLGKQVEIESGLEDRRRYYRLRSKSQETALGFSFEELHYLAVCRDLAAPFLPEKVAERINRSLTTLALQLGEESNTAIFGAPVRFRSKGHIDYIPHVPTIGALRQAISKRQVCRVSYHPAGEAAPRPYRYAPGHIFAMSGTLYVQGYRIAEGSLLKERATTFSLHRIAKVEPTGEYFHFDAADPESGAFGLNWHKSVRVSIDIDAQAADYVRDRIWSDDQSIEEQAGGGLVLSVTTTSEKELNAWVNSFGGLARIIDRAESTSIHPNAFPESTGQTGK